MYAYFGFARFVGKWLKFGTADEFLDHILRQRVAVEPPVLGNGHLERYHPHFSDNRSKMPIKPPWSSHRNKRITLHIAQNLAVLPQRKKAGEAQGLSRRLAPGGRRWPANTWCAPPPSAPARAHRGYAGSRTPPRGCCPRQACAPCPQSPRRHTPATSRTSGLRTMRQPLPVVDLVGPT